MSQIKVDAITDELGTGSPSFPNGVDAADLTGTLPALDGSALTGVGGATTLITDWTDIATGASAVNVNFTENYFKYVLLFNEIKMQGSALGLLLSLRLTDSSGTALSGSDSYQYGSRNSGGLEDTRVALMGSVHGVDAAGSMSNQVYVEIFTPKSSTERTWYHAKAIRQEYGNPAGYQNFWGYMENLEVNNGVTLFENGGGTFDSGRYKVYGVNI